MKDGFIKVAAATPRIRVADCGYNASEIIRLCHEAGQLGVKILVFPELCVTGYTCADLFLQDTLPDSAEAALSRILAETRRLDMLIAVGLPARYMDKLYNCAAVINRGKIQGLVAKSFLPNYGEFYEKRWFEPGPSANLVDARICGSKVPFGTDFVFPCSNVPGLCVGVEICEDLWASDPPSKRLAAMGASVILNLSASNELVGKAAYRRELVKNQSARLLAAYIYADAGEGESTTDLVFAGHDIIAENGAILAESRFKTGLTVSEIDVERLAFERRRNTTFRAGELTEPALRYGYYVMNPDFWLRESDTALTRPVGRSPFVPADPAEREERCAEIFEIQVRGLKKRMEHTGCQKLVVGVSGGLDSTLAMLVSAGALRELKLPPDGLLAVTMPCFGTTERTKSNAVLLAEKLGAELRCVDITASVRRHFEDIGHDENDRSVTYENAQARERTQVLMDIANSLNGLVVGTGDLSELALGWATYNGDHMSMYGVNAGVPKTLVRYLVGWYADTRGDGELAAVLNDILATPVSPELLPAENGEISQRTEDLVGPYELHDFFLYYFVRWGMAPKKIYRLAKYAFAGVYDDGTVLKWLKTFLSRFFSQQFKRSCLPDGPKVGSVALSPRGDWRMPSDAAVKAWLRELEETDV